MTRPHFVEIDDAYRAHHGNPQYQPDRLAEKLAEDDANAIAGWIADLERALSRTMKAMLWVTLLLALTIAVLAFARAKVAEVQAMPRYVEGF